MTQASTLATTSTVGGAATGRPGRIASLDTVRGLFLCVSVVSASLLAPKPEFAKHAEWFGVHAVDLVFPLFVTLSGCGLAFAYRNRVGWAATIRRSVVLLIAGLAYNAVVANSVDFATMRFTGPLQVYAVLVLVIGVLHLVIRTPRAWILTTAVFAAAQAAFLYLWQNGCPGNELLPSCNPSRVIDLALLGKAHMYAAGAMGHDPEGLVSILGALVTMCVGTTAGHLMLARRNHWRAPVHVLVWAAAVFVAARAADQILPAMKRLWTTPFALEVGALGAVILAAGLIVMDLPAPGWWQRLRTTLAWPVIGMGRNSLLVYFGSHLLVFVMLTHGGDTSWAARMAERVEWHGHTQLSFIAVMLVFWMLTAAVLHRFKVYLRP